MRNTVTSLTLFEAQKDKLRLKWLSGKAGQHRPINDDSSQESRSALVGHLNAIHPNQIQLLGRWEFEYLSSLRKNSHHDVLHMLYANKPAAIIVSDGLEASSDFIALSEKTDTPLFSSRVTSQKIINRIQYYLGQQLAETQILHGVFMEVHGMGVLLSGDSGIGKSELALELINRGQRLIADDAPEFSRIAPDTIRGSCPEALRDFLEVRGLGILNIREMYGDSAIKPSKNLRLIVRLTLLSNVHEHSFDRLEGSYRNIGFMDVEIPEVMIPVAPGRSLAVLVEAAARQHIQLLSGYNATQDFILKQQRLIDSTQNETDNN